MTRAQVALLGLAAVAVAAAPAPADDKETVRENLFQAKKDYDAEAAKFRKAAAELFDKREDSARQVSHVAYCASSASG